MCIYSAGNVASRANENGILTIGRVLEKCMLPLVDIAHLIQELTRLLEPLLRSFRITIYAKVIFGNFDRGESVNRSNLPHTIVILEANPGKNVSRWH